MGFRNGSINILMVDSERTWRGGEGQLFLLMKGLVAEGFSVTLAAAEDSAIAKRASALGVPCMPLEIAGGMDLAAAWRLRSYLRDGDFDIVHCHSSHAHSVAFLAERVARVKRVPRKPLLVVSRRVDFPVGKNGFGGLKYRRGADVFIAISNGVRDVLKSGGVDEGRLELVRSGIDLDKFAGVRGGDGLRNEFGIDAGTTVIGNVAALAPHKSQVDFIRAAKQVAAAIKDTRFLIVGEGAMRPRLEALIDELGMGRQITLTGFREDVLELLAMFDCFVLSSYLEGLCTSIMDAQAMGIPVVATRTGGVPDLVEDGVTGLLAPPRDPDALAHAIVRMVTDRELREKCKDGAQARAQTYDYRNMVGGTIDVYRRLLGNNARVN